jgi:hypothetical protein
MVQLQHDFSLPQHTWQFLRQAEDDLDGNVLTMPATCAVQQQHKSLKRRDFCSQHVNSHKCDVN